MRLKMRKNDKPKARRRSQSAVTSGRRLLTGGDPNSAWSRRYFDLVSRHISDLGGKDMLSEAQVSLIRRAAALSCEIEAMEARMSQGAEVNLDSFGRAASHLRRLYETLGLERRSKPAEDLQTYLHRTAYKFEEAPAEAIPEGDTTGS
jgi:hypothetical protein